MEFAYICRENSITSFKNKNQKTRDMDTTIFAKIIAEALQLREGAVANTMTLLDEGATIPFIARYRKERTGGLDEVKIGQISDHYDRLKELAKRKETILKTIGEQGKLTPELQKQIETERDGAGGFVPAIQASPAHTCTGGT